MCPPRTGATRAAKPALPALNQLIPYRGATGSQLSLWRRRFVASPASQPPPRLPPSVPVLARRSRQTNDLLDTDDALEEPEETEVDSILSSDNSLLDESVSTPVRPVRQGSGMSAKHVRRTGLCRLIQCVRQRLSCRRAIAGQAGGADEEKAKLVTRTPKKRSLKQQSLITVPTETLLRALRAKMAAAGWDVPRAPLEPRTRQSRAHRTARRAPDGWGAEAAGLSPLVAAVVQWGGDSGEGRRVGRGARLRSHVHPSRLTCTGHH